MELFDCNCWYGVPKSPPTAGAETPEALLGEMERAGIARALVRSAAIFEESPEVGNRLTAEGARGDPRLEPAWGMLPPQTREVGDVDDFLEAMRQEGVRALWAYPEKHRYLLNASVMGELLEEMQSRGIPLFVHRREMPGNLDTYRLAHQVLADFPQLHLVIVAHGSWGEDRLFRPLMQRYPNFMVDTSRYELDGGIEDLCRSYGSRRLLFGTNFPETPMGGPILTLLRARISDEDRELIAGGNLRRMLEEVRL
ncbi:MAG: amidohydrolase family protein [Armatimonadota bacterium]|nr:amidohydrolase family protein [Armatimonadota bacterium]